MVGTGPGSALRCPERSALRALRYWKSGRDGSVARNSQRTWKTTVG